MFKKTAILIMLAIAVLCCGCSEKEDPPEVQTGTYIESESGEVMKKPLRMIRIGGKLFYDTERPAEVTEAEIRDLVKEGEIYEIPKNDGGCNFDGAFGYQDYTSITKIVIFGEERILFRMFDDPELDMSAYKYCFYLKGHFQELRSTDELAALTDDIDITYDKLKESLLSATVSPQEIIRKTTFKNFNDPNAHGITLSAKNVTPNGMTIECEQFGGEVTGTLQTGDWYLLEANVNDEWVPVPPMLGEADYAWSVISYGIPQNEITTIDVDWTWLYGTLQPGDYRMTKEITDYRKAGDFYKDRYYITFTVQ